MLMTDFSSSDGDTEAPLSVAPEASSVESSVVNRLINSTKFLQFSDGNQSLVTFPGLCRDAGDMIVNMTNVTTDCNAGPGTWLAIPAVVLQKVSLISVFMVIALIGNTMVLAILLKRRKKQRNVAAFFISLAASDILIAIFSMPTEVFWDVFGGWLFGNVACKVLTYLQCILFASTAFIHMSISYDRYEAICKPMFFTKRYIRNRWMIRGSWILAFIIAIPQLFIFLEIETGTGNDGVRVYACRSNGYSAEWQRKLYVTWNAFYMFLVPLCTITICYALIAKVVWKYDASTNAVDEPSNNNSNPENVVIRNNTIDRSQSRTNGMSKVKLKTIQVTVCVLVSYTFCWIPYFTVALLNVWSDYRYRDVINSSPMGPLAQCLCWFSSCVNPIIYGFFHLPHQLRNVKCCSGSLRSSSSQAWKQQRGLHEPFPFHVPHVNTAVAQQMFPVRTHWKRGCSHQSSSRSSQNDGVVHATRKMCSLSLYSPKSLPVNL